MFLHLDKPPSKSNALSNNKLKKESKVELNKPKKISKQKRQKIKEECIESEEKEKYHPSESDSGIEPEEDNDVEVETDPEDETAKSSTAILKSISLPGVSSFFSVGKKQPIVEDSSSDDEDNVSLQYI